MYSNGKKGPIAILGLLIFAAVLLMLVIMIYQQGKALQEVSKPEGRARTTQSDSYDKDSFTAGLMAGVDVYSIELLYSTGVIPEETYNRLYEALDKYLDNPCKATQSEWYDIYEDAIKDFADSIGPGIRPKI